MENKIEKLELKTPEYIKEWIEYYDVLITTYEIIQDFLSTKIGKKITKGEMSKLKLLLPSTYYVYESYEDLKIDVKTDIIDSKSTKESKSWCPIKEEWEYRTKYHNTTIYGPRIRAWDTKNLVPLTQEVIDHRSFKGIIKNSKEAQKRLKYTLENYETYASIINTFNSQVDTLLKIREETFEALKPFNE